MKSIKTSCKPLALVLLVIMLTSCGRGRSPASSAEEGSSGEKQQRQVFAMDTVMLLTAYGADAQPALEAAEELILALEADLDPENEGSSVHSLNAGAGTPVPVSQDCYNIMSTTLEVWASTGGALDPGTYPLSKAWGFIGGAYRVPPEEEIRALLPAGDAGGIRLDGDACTAVIPSGAEVAFGAVAKGYAAQAVCGLLAERGIGSAIVSLGGNVQTLGEKKPDGSPWQVAVTDPRDPGSYVGILETGQTAVVTSGGYQRCFERDGVTYIHILDPSTGYPVDNGLLSVTVAAEDGALADALSTALFVLGEDGALAYCGERDGIELILVTEDGRVIVTPGLRDSFTETSENYAYEYPG